MDCHLLMYKPIKSNNPYEKYIAKQKEKQLTQKKELFYSQILKFTSSRYPKEFMLELEKQINPFQHSLQTLRNIILARYPDLPEDVVNQSVQYVFGKKAREATMIKQSQTIIEDGEQYIRNGRKLIKQDFSYSFKKIQNDSVIPIDPSKSQILQPQNLASSRGELTKRSITIRNDLFQKIRKEQNQSPFQTDRQLLSSPRKRLTSVSKNQLFNEMIAEELEKQNNRHKNIHTIFQGDSDDILIKQENFKKIGFTDRSARSGFNNQSFPNFRERDVVVAPEGGIQTGRTDMEQLNHLLSQISIKCEQKDGLTNRSDRGLYTMKIYKKNMENLYNMKGSLKIDTIRRAANRLMSEYS